MPSRKPSQERIEQVKTQFEAAESKILEISKEPDKERHFKLLYNVALEAVDADLSKIAYRLWIYLSANYPFSDREVELPSQTELGIRLGVSRQAINIAAAELQSAGLWDFWAERWKGRNLRGFSSPGKGVTKNRQVSAKPDTVSAKPDTRCQQKPTGCQQNLTPCQENLTPPPLEPLPQEDFKTPHTIQTYSDFKKTLSEGERENFEKFAEEEAANMPKPPTLVNKWIAGNFTELYKQFKAAPKKEDVRLKPSEQRKLIAELRDKDWQNDPRHDEWLRQAHQKGREWYLDPKDKFSQVEKLERGMFYDWCLETKAFAPLEGIP